MLIIVFSTAVVYVKLKYRTAVQRKFALFREWFARYSINSNVARLLIFLDVGLLRKVTCRTVKMRPLGALNYEL